MMKISDVKKENLYKNHVIKLTYYTSLFLNPTIFIAHL
jgi:hypothetical protein